MERIDYIYKTYYNNVKDSEVELEFGYQFSIYSKNL